MSTCNYSISFAAVLGDQTLKVIDGKIHSLSITSERSFENVDCYGIKQVYFKMPTFTQLDLSLSVAEGGLLLKPYDPSHPFIGDKLVSDCAIDELLFAIQYMLGIVTGKQIGRAHV